MIFQEIVIGVITWDGHYDTSVIVGPTEQAVRREAAAILNTRMSDDVFDDPIDPLPVSAADDDEVKVWLDELGQSNCTPYFKIAAEHDVSIVAGLSGVLHLR